MIAFSMKWSGCSLSISFSSNSQYSTSKFAWNSPAPFSLLSISVSHVIVVVVFVLKKILEIYQNVCSAILLSIISAMMNDDVWLTAFTTCAFRGSHWLCDWLGWAPEKEIQKQIRMDCRTSGSSAMVTFNMSAASFRLTAIWSDSLRSSSAFSDLYKCVTNSDCKLSLT